VSLEDVLTTDSHRRHCVNFVHGVLASQYKFAPLILLSVTV
jgi:hypothetical protein